ncbi:hypothetical protein L596_015285 [Steinernema carpocapsae]|uniref:C-type lectin domain-containing protein n=1 Tax=Steinernema carpocapsae TaxID=34508 RepID=A0A4V6A323_STECR|nr:hypothetical protein L596_015285 [Steinernema carpocapsae]
MADTLDFDQAEATCNYVGGHLASIHSAGEAVFINFSFEPEEAFLGGIFIDETDKCWTDGTTMADNIVPGGLSTVPYCLIVTPKLFNCSPTTTTTTTTTTAAPTTTLPPEIDCPYRPIGTPISTGSLTWKPYGLNEFAFVQNAAKFADAEATCVKLGGHLASEHDQSQLIYLGLLLPPLPYQPREFYVGGIQSRAGNKCWTDGSNFDFTANINSVVPQPFCFLQYESGILNFKWNGVHCDEPHSFVCSRPQASVTTTLPPVTPTGPPSQLTCPFKSTQTPIPTAEPVWKTVLGKKYAFLPGPLKFTDAVASCAYLGGNLASIHSVLQSGYLAALVPLSSTAWIGGLSPGQDRYCWSDGSSWNYDQIYVPNLNPHCVQLSLVNAWSTINCANVAGYICEK